MGFRYQLNLYVISTASNVRTHVRGKLVVNDPLKALLSKEAPKLLRLVDGEEKLWMYAGEKGTTRRSLEEATSRIIYDIAPILAVARQTANPFVRCELYFSDATITKAFSKGLINNWNQNGFTRRSGGQPLEHGWLWGLLYKLVGDLKLVVCYNPFDDPLMQAFHDDLKSEYRRIVKQLKKNWSTT